MSTTHYMMFVNREKKARDLMKVLSFGGSYKTQYKNMNKLNKKTFFQFFFCQDQRVEQNIKLQKVFFPEICLSWVKKGECKKKKTTSQTANIIEFIDKVSLYYRSLSVLFSVSFLFHFIESSHRKKVIWHNTKYQQQRLK